MRILLIPAVILLMTACGNNKKNEKDKVETAADTTTATIKEDAGNPVAADDKKGSITGIWKPADVNIRDIDEEEKKEMTANIRIEFTGDGKFFGYNKEKKQEGTYTYNEKDGQLTVLNVSRGDKAEKFTIGWEDGLLLMTNEDGTVKLKKQ
ncbi:MAG: hypothetical protein ACT4OJ_11260 [Bacteroidota bacterium]